MTSTFAVALMSSPADVKVYFTLGSAAWRFEATIVVPKASARVGNRLLIFMCCLCVVGCSVSANEAMNWRRICKIKTDRLFVVFWVLRAGKGEYPAEALRRRDFFGNSVVGSDMASSIYF